MVAFGPWLAKQIRRRKLSQEAAARELDVSVSTVRRWLGGRSDPRYDELWKVLEVFGTVPFCEGRRRR